MAPLAASMGMCVRTPLDPNPQSARPGRATRRNVPHPRKHLSTRSFDGRRALKLESEPTHTADAPFVRQVARE